jgi:hypothetical protein
MADAPELVGLEVTLETCIRKVHDSNLGQELHYLD